MRDSYNREINYLRLSLTDRCQLKCQYCVPKTGVNYIKCNKLLNIEEINEIVQAFAKLGVKKIKLTGGEPLLRLDLITIVQNIKNIIGVEEVTLTTNGVGLSDVIEDLVKAGLDGVNISLDTLDIENYTFITGRNKLDSALKGIESATKNKELKVKVNCVAINELNRSQIIEITNLAKNKYVHVRFIEYMPIGTKKNLTPISQKDICKLLSNHYGAIKPFNQRLGNGPANYYTIRGFKGKIGFISPLSQEFCNTCNRVRVTCDGFLKTCLYSNQGIDLRKYLKSGNLELQIIKALKIKSKCHSFNDNNKVDDYEERNMIQIGG